MNKTVFSLIFLLAFCFLTGTEPDFYVWQRHHTSEVQQAVEELNEIMKTKAEDQRKQTQRKMFDAVKKNDLKEAEKCLLQGADVNRPDEKGLVPLHYAAVCEHVEMVKWLLAHGADVNRQNDLTYWTPLHYALGSDDFTDFTEGLRPKPNPEKTLELVRLLVEAKANINAEDDHGLTPVYLALADLNILKYLSEHGGCLDAGDAYRGQSPLHFAIHDASLEVIEFILKKGGINKINESDGNGYAPLHHAVLCTNLEFVKCLVEHGADINQVIEEDGETPLDLAEDSSDFAKYLKARGDESPELAKHLKKRKKALSEIAKYLKVHGAVSGKSAGKSIGH